jgi:2-polyprenyl-3-methyl-5-hydroxy-6-metoxy-1,4-benzoquinol methylase
MTEPKPKPLPPLPASVLAGKIPSWNMTSLCRRPCPVCQTEAASVVCYRPDQLRVARCAECSMLYLPEVPNSDEISKFYQGYGHFKGLTAGRLSKRQLARASRADQHIAILQATGGLRGASLVEVGCAFGDFLQLARYLGAKVTGVEVDGKARSCLESLDIPNQEALRGNERADIICAFQLLEHLEQPATFIAQVSRALSTDGRLLLALPNGGEFEAVGESWVGFRVDLEHLNYFSTRTLTRLLAKFDLFVEQFWLHSQPAVQRAVPARLERLGLGPRLERLSKRLMARLAGPPVSEAGTFVLSALARKAAA